MPPSNDKRDLKSLYTGEYVRGFERYPVSRILNFVRFIDLKKDDDVADIGCGNGMLLSVIHDKIGRYTGVDFSDEFIAAAGHRAKKEGISNAEFESSDITAFAERHPNRFDKVFAIDFTEHISDVDFIRIFTALRRTLKDGGELYLHTPNGGYFVEILKKTGIMKQFPEHIAIRTAEEYLTLLKKSGFGTISVKYLPHYNILRHLRFLSSVFFTGSLFKARIFIRCKV